MYMGMEEMTHTTGAENRYCTLSGRSRRGEEGYENGGGTGERHTLALKRCFHAITCDDRGCEEGKEDDGGKELHRDVL